jgi:hypothetical protein
VSDAFSMPLPPPPPPRGRRRFVGVLLAVLLILVLIFALVVVFPLVMGPQVEQMLSSDWSGYSVASDLSFPEALVSGVNGSWVVPSVSVSVGSQYSAVWVGVGGQFDDTLIQVGTEQDVVGGRAVYSVWYELLPADAVTVDSLSVSAGDRVVAWVMLVDVAGGVWSLGLVDVSTGRSVSRSVVYGSSRLSAEWVVERPTVGNRVTTLTDFGEVVFSGCNATVNGREGVISSFSVTRILMVSRANVRLVGVSSLGSGGSSFTVTYLG